MDENRLRQLADGKRRDAERLAADKDSVMRSHEQNIKGMEDQMAAIQNNIATEKGLADKDSADFDARIQQANSEADSYDKDADAARDAADAQQKAQAALAAAAAAERNARVQQELDDSQR